VSCIRDNSNSFIDFAQIRLETAYALSFKMSSIMSTMRVTTSAFISLSSLPALFLRYKKPPYCSTIAKISPTLQNKCKRVLTSLLRLISY